VAAVPRLEHALRTVHSAYEAPIHSVRSQGGGRASAAYVAQL
jgi:hypothetical protein